MNLNATTIISFGAVCGKTTIKGFGSSSVIVRIVMMMMVKNAKNCYSAEAKNELGLLISVLLPLSFTN